MTEIVYVRDAKGNLVQTTIEDLREDMLEKLEEENKELYNKRMGVCDRVYELEEENKNLKEWAEENSYLRAKNRRLEAENNKLNTRINTMQEFIDYSEGVVHNAICMLYEEGGDEKALDYLENCYAVGDERQYEEMEKLDTED